MALQFGVIVPQGWRMDLVGIADPVEAYETMTRVAQVAEEVGFDSIWLFDHFHTVPQPTQEVTFECWTSTAALKKADVFQRNIPSGRFREQALVGTPEAIRTRLREIEQAGAQEVIIYLPDAASLESVRLFARECIRK